MQRAESLWYVSPGSVELRPEALPPSDADSVLVRALYSGISRGTERLVLKGLVPDSEHERMRCPFQEGAFPFPVKYGYSLVGCIAEGPPDRIGQAVFLLHPHQSLLRVPLGVLHPLPAGLPPRRAALAANMETALNVVWDAGVAPGDRVLVVGGGVVGLLIARLAALIPGTEVTVVDPLAAREAVAKRLGAAFASPAAAPGEQDVVIHTSASEAGLRLALACAGRDALVIEASWHGARQVSLPLGEAFHAKRLRLRSSQVGAVPPERSVRWTRERRLGVALRLLLDEACDTFITGELSFADAPALLPGLLTGEAVGLMTVLRYA